MKYAPIVIKPQPARTLPKTNEAFLVWIEGTDMPVTVRYYSRILRRTWDQSVVHPWEVVAWAETPVLIPGSNTQEGSGLNRGLELAATLLKETAEDFEQMSNNIKPNKVELGYFGQVSEKKSLLEKAQLLRGQAKLVLELNP